MISGFETCQLGEAYFGHPSHMAIARNIAPMNNEAIHRLFFFTCIPPTIKRTRPRRPDPIITMNPIS